MKKLVLATLLATLATFGTGCIISSGDDGVDPGDDGVDPPDESTLTVNWAIGNVATPGVGVDCPPGADAVLYTTPLNDNYTVAGSTLQTTFPCADYEGSVILPADLYEVYLEIDGIEPSPQWEEGMNPLDRNDFEDLVTNATDTHSFSFWLDGGYFAVEWSLPPGSTCAGAGVDGAYFTPTLSGTTFMGDPDVFNCEAGFGITAEYQEGLYELAGQAVDANDAALGDSYSQTVMMLDNNVTIRPPTPYGLELDDP